VLLEDGKLVAETCRRYVLNTIHLVGAVTESVHLKGYVMDSFKMLSVVVSAAWSYFSLAVLFAMY
jgi:hypothetical protein